MGKISLNPNPLTFGSSPAPHDPVATLQALIPGHRLEPVDHDPWASQRRLIPVNHDPFAKKDTKK